jgi:hypothetical protein
MLSLIMDDGRIELVIEGLPENDGKVHLRTLISEIQSLSITLNKLDREASNGKGGSVFEVVAMSYASPYRIAVLPTPLPDVEFTGPLVIKALSNLSTALISKADLNQFDSEVLGAIRALAKPVGKTVKAVNLRFGGAVFDMNARIVARIDEALAVDEECEGFIEGMLEQINLHDGVNIFHIYPEVGPNKVACHFPVRLVEEAVAAVGRRVEIFGTLRYRAGVNFPYQVAVADIDAHPPNHELPDWDDVRGRAPDCTGDLSSEDFIRELRDGWS